MNDIRSNIAKTLVVVAACAAWCSVAAPAQQRAAWLQKARWGVMTHYLADWKSEDSNLEMNVGEWNKLIDDFDVEGLATQLQSVGAAYYQISIGQNSGYYLSPNPNWHCP